MNYYQGKLFLSHVDKKNQILGPVERWEAHQKGILHRGFTVAVFYHDQMICQHRKHPVFNGYLDLTASSHPIFIADTLQDELEAVYQTLKREWGIVKEQFLYPPEFKGKVLYQSQDGQYTEHEICSLYQTEVKSLPQPNFDYAYGFSLLKSPDLKATNTPLTKILAPWVQKFIRKGLV